MFRFLLIACCVLILPGVALAEEIKRGPITQLPLPRFVSMKASEGNVRRGPSSTHRVDWVFKRRHIPLQIIGEYGHWRRVVDRDGAGGWMHYTLLSGNRTVLIDHDLAPLHRKPRHDAHIVAYAEMGVVGHVGKCADGWCQLEIGSTKGWVQTQHLWGVAPDEVRD